MKKNLISALIVALVISVLPVQGFAADVTEEKQTTSANEMSIVEESREVSKPSWFQPVSAKVNGYQTLRLAGDTRYETSLMCAEAVRQLRGYSKFRRLVIASATNYPDALSGASLAGELDGTPIILVSQSEEENQQIYEYINDYTNKDAKIYILGGEAAVPASVVSTLAGNGFTNIERLQGKDRYETNLAVIEEMNTRDTKRVIIATGKNFADSLAMSSYAYSQEWPIMLVDDSMTEAQLTKLREISPSRISIVGGTNAVSETVEKQLETIVESQYIHRYAGTDRYDTAIQVADDWCYVSGEYTKSSTKYDAHAVLAYGGNFPDALAASAVAGLLDAPIVLVDEDSSRQSTFLREGTEVEEIITIGGTSVIPDSVVNQFSR